MAAAHRHGERHTAAPPTGRPCGLFWNDGTVLVSALVPTYGEVLLTARTSDRIFRNDFK